MEFFYSCVTCAHMRRHRDSPFVRDDSKMWCALHSIALPTGPGSKDAICCDFLMSDPQATVPKHIIASFPQGELWTFEECLPSRKLATISDLPAVDIVTGEFSPVPQSEEEVHRRHRFDAMNARGAEKAKRMSPDDISQACKFAVDTLRSSDKK